MPNVVIAIGTVRDGIQGQGKRKVAIRASTCPDPRLLSDVVVVPEHAYIGPEFC